jgi:hypothetical protein
MLIIKGVSPISPELDTLSNNDCAKKKFTDYKWIYKLENIV